MVRHLTDKCIAPNPRHKQPLSCPEYWDCWTFGALASRSSHAVWLQCCLYHSLILWTSHGVDQMPLGAPGLGHRGLLGPRACQVSKSNSGKQIIPSGWFSIWRVVWVWAMKRGWCSGFESFSLRSERGQVWIIMIHWQHWTWVKCMVLASAFPVCVLIMVLLPVCSIQWVGVKNSATGILLNELGSRFYFLLFVILNMSFDLFKSHVSLFLEWGDEIF